MVKQYKIDEVSDLSSKLDERKNIILTDYSGVKVKGLNELRSRLREKGAEYKVVKNNLFRLALKEKGYEAIDEHLKGPTAVAFAGDQFGEIAKILKNFRTEEENFSYSIGVFDNVIYSEDQVKTIADLPSHDAILGQVMSLVNGPAQGIAIGMNQIMSSLARGIQAVAESNNN